MVMSARRLVITVVMAQIVYHTQAFSLRKKWRAQ